MVRRRNPTVVNRTIRTDAGLDHMTSTAGRSERFDLRSLGFCPRGHTVQFISFTPALTVPFVASPTAIGRQQLISTSKAIAMAE